MSSLATSPLASSSPANAAAAAAAAAITTTTTTTTTRTPSSPKRSAMSVAETYSLAHTARGKLSSEAARADHNLRLLVGHANLLDCLMLELAAAESEQEQWFHHSLTRASKTAEPRHIHWADAMVEDPEEDWHAEDADTSDTDSEYESDGDDGGGDDDDDDMEVEPGHRIPPRRARAGEEMTAYEVDGEEDLDRLQLLLAPARSHFPPELDHDSDSSEDEAMPPSPPSDTLPSFAAKPKSLHVPPIASIPASEQQAFFDEGFYLPPRARPGLLSAVRVY
ncbi:hypothetical protein B2J93_6841 [Marssonina coronariae]|uniref:Uncharacterized protein n=1 Tax=Diplocarpon coronariae TaxID=2795749 RepID=A0A218YVH9_9HELO|nr:hypothetical protein B2J93_6841 [Marssonina coronariae]